MLNYKLLGSALRVSDSVGWELDLIICISKKFLGNADAASNLLA